MAVPQFDTNTWYSLQNLGTNSYIGCNSISICGADVNDLTNFELFQINPISEGTSYFIRPKARDVDNNGDPFCVNIVRGQPFLELCTNNSAVWGAGYWNGNDAAEGVYLYDNQQNESDRLFLTEEGRWAFPDYDNVAPGDVDHMKWDLSSRAAINDQAYSTTPGVIPISLFTGLVTGSATLFDAPTVSGEARTAASTDASTDVSTDVASPSATEAPQTTTASTSRQTVSQSSTASTTQPTQANGAARLSSNARTAGALIMMVVVPQLATWLS